MKCRASTSFLLSALIALTAASAGAQAQSRAADPKTRPQDTMHSNGGYLHSRLMPAQPQGSCPPDIDPLYSAYAIVTGTDMRQRPWGFAQTLREVLVKTSGDPHLGGDPRVAPLAAEADRFVACFDYLDMMANTPIHDEQGTYDRPHKLTVFFDPAGIDALLGQLGDTPWRGERPVIIPMLRITGPRPPSYLLSAEIGRGSDQRGAFETAAGEFGLAVRFPSDGELAEWGVSADSFPGSAPESRAGEALVVGTLVWSETLPGWIGAWHARWRGAEHAWGISGVNYDAAFRDIVRGVMLLASGRGSPD